MYRKKSLSKELQAGTPLQDERGQKLALMLMCVRVRSSHLLRTVLVFGLTQGSEWITDDLILPSLSRQQSVNF